jgi:nucleoside-diphosphate-sugar epimerase
MSKDLREIWDKENSLVVDDLKDITCDKVIPWQKFSNKSVLITGATGLLGLLLVKALVFRSDFYNENITVGALVRNEKKFRSKCSWLLDSHTNIKIEIADISAPINIEKKYDYVIHTACCTDSKSMVEKPVETLLTIIEGTKNILDYARKFNVESIIYLSSMEVYGKLDNEIVSENDYGYIDTLNARSSYPLGKRVAENLCFDCFSEYGLPIKIARLTLTFGPGIDQNDQRVFAQFARAVLNKTDIVLNSKGGTKRDYLYTADAIKGLLSILLLGKDGEAYNLSNSKSYISILEMAQIFKKIANNEIDIKIDLDPEKCKKYPKEMHVNLNTSKLEQLNKIEFTDFYVQIEKLIDYMKSID